MLPDRILLTEAQIQARVLELGQALTLHYRGKRPVFLGVMNGALFFLADLVRASVLDDLEISTIRVASYDGTQSTGILRGLDALADSFSGRHVLLVDDILETGLTLATLVRQLRELGAAEVKTCVLLEKDAIRVEPMQADWTGFKIAREFVVGYGLDYQGRYRQLREIRVLENPA